MGREYFEGLAKKDFDLIPYDDDVSLRAPLAPGGIHKPLVGKQNLSIERSFLFDPAQRTPQAFSCIYAEKEKAFDASIWTELEVDGG